MKAIKTFVFAIIFCCIYAKTNAQTVNWNAVDNSRHIISIGVGWDYSVSYSVGYAYQVNTPLLLTANFSIPAGENLLDDFKTRIGAQVVLINEANFKGSLILNGIYRRYENPLVSLQNFGSEVKGAFGYYRQKWFVAGEVGFDKAIVTHFRHSETFMENIFQIAKGGWYEPASGGNFLYGIQTGFSFKKSSISMNFGMVTTQDFKTTPLIPYYLMLGYSYSIN